MTTPQANDQTQDAPHHERPYRRLVLPEDLVTDQAVADAGGDEFHHAAIAKAVADLTISSATPVNVALFGPWGSGKSTFYNLMKKRVEQQDRRVAVVYYDAWKYGGQDLKRHFIQSVAAQLQIKRAGDLDRELTLNQEQSRLRLRRWFRYNWPSILGAFGVGLLVASLWVALHAAVVAKLVQPSKDFKEVLPQYVGEFGLVVAAILTALLLGPKALESAVVKTTRPAVDRDDQFARMFSELVRRVKKHTGAHRLVVFIDELDRCEPDDVVATLVDLKTFLDEEDCVFVVAADRDVLEHALRHVPQAKPIRQDAPYYSTPGAFIDKIFQHQVGLPPLRAHALSSFAHGLVGNTPTGLWRSLREADSSGRLFDDVVYILVPAHVTSPRRVKILLNNFATSARIAESRHINWVARARELAFLTVLETEFASVAAALVRFPRLLGHLRGDELPGDASPDRKALIKQFTYDPSTPPPSGESVSGSIVRDREGDGQSGVLTRQEELAKHELARQLSEYLDKLTVVSGLHDPRPDLFYLRVVGYDDGLTDPELGEMIDMAAERQPAVVVAAFHDQTSHIRAVAVRLLVQTLASERGTGQANVLEAACRLVQQLDAGRVEQVAHLAPEVLTHVGRSTWRANAIPGAVYLAGYLEEGEDHVEALMALLRATEPSDVELLTAALPALEWMNDEAAKHVHDKVAEVLATTSLPLTTLLSERSDTQATRGWTDAADAVAAAYASASANEVTDLFEALTKAVMARPHPHPSLLWKILLKAQNQQLDALIGYIHDNRETLLDSLSHEHRVCAALYQIELGPRDEWPDWLPYLTNPPDDIRYISQFARDAAKAIIKAVPAATDDLGPTYESLASLLSDEHTESVVEVLLETLPAIGWGETTDEESVRRKSLDAIARMTTRRPEQQTRYEQAQLEALESSIATQLPKMSAATAPKSLFDDWRNAVRALPAAQARSFDQGQAKVTAPTPAAKVEHLRLRIAARRNYGGRSLAPSVLNSVAGQPTASVMAGEWLDLRPSAANVAAVHKQIPIGTAALLRYAEKVNLDERTSLWIALEEDNASRGHLQAVGRAGVDGSAIRHMASKIVEPALQAERDETMDRLLLAKFSEVPTKAERASGATRGHKEASELAWRLVSKGGYDNIVLAARAVIHSGGVGHGSKGKLHRAFTSFAHGKQARNFTKKQAEALRGLEVLTPKKRGRMSWMFDRS